MMPSQSDTPHGAAQELSVGSIRPTGWLLRQARLQAEGLTGHLEDVWPDVDGESGWRGGTGESWERAPYYLDGLVPLAYQLADESLMQRAQPWIEWILASQDETGFFGPAASRDWWPRIVALKALTQYADATGDPRVEPFVSRYLRFQWERLTAEPLTDWGRARGADNALSAWWLYRRKHEAWLLELVDLLAAQTLDWERYLTRDLITGPARSFNHFTHGPNVAMGLKAGALAFLRDGSAMHREATELSLALLDRWHGVAHGWFSGDEFLGGREATAGVETCQVVETMFSMEVLTRTYGGGIYGDRLESLAFNLLPASCDPLMRAHQYHQQANQVQVSVGRRSWSYSGDDANIFGLEPYFGCCTANLHQGWPKFISSLWAQTPDGGLMSIAYAPCTVRTDIAGVSVGIDVETDYPFDETVTIRLSLQESVAFPLRLRIPGWAADTATIALPASEQTPVAGVVDGYLLLNRTWDDGDVVTLVFPHAPELVRRERQSAVIRFGPLTMALKIGENWIATPEAKGLGEWEIHPRRSWNYAVVLDHPHEWVVKRHPVGAVPFELDSAPVRITARGARVRSWRLDGVQAGMLPNSPVNDIEALEPIELVPYGSARLRVTEFPTIDPRIAAAIHDPVQP